MKVTYLERSPGTWRLRIETASPTGARAFSYETVHGDEEAARKRRFELLQEHETGTWAKPEKILLSAYLERWTAQRLALGVIGRSTAESQTQYMDTHVKPLLGGKRLQAVTGADVQNVYTVALTQSGLSKSSTRLLHSMLVTAFKDARKAKLIKVNPMEEVTAPELARNRKAKAITADAAVQMVADLRGSWLYAPVMVGLGAGLRRGEVCGLRRKDVDLANAKLQVRGQIVQYKDRSIEWKETKTEAGVRPVSLPAELVDVLRTVLRGQAEARMGAGIGAAGLEDAYVFSADANGLEPFVPDNLTARFRTFCTNHGLPEFTFHGTRHTHATHMLKAVGREGAKAVSQRLGHADVNITLDVYQTVFESDDRELGDLASGLFGGAKK